jgi:hypothetical protein
MELLSLRFVSGETGSFRFDTGVLKGVMRQEGEYNALHKLG